MQVRTRTESRPAGAAEKIFSRFVDPFLKFRSEPERRIARDMRDAQARFFP
jgi:hypothetical protein